VADFKTTQKTIGTAPWTGGPVVHDPADLIFWASHERMEHAETTDDAISSFFASSFSASLYIVTGGGSAAPLYHTAKPCLDNLTTAPLHKALYTKGCQLGPCHHFRNCESHWKPSA